MKMNNSSVLVTGGAGFIGSELTRQLAEQYKDVHVVDNLVNGRRENIEGLLDKNVHLHADDIRDNKRMRQLLEGVDIVFHLACLGVRHSIHSPMESHEVNATATLELLKASREIGVKRFVYVSSSEVYGTAKWAPMTEEHPTFPMTVYGAAKLAGECYTRAFYRTYDYPTVVVRPFNSYGPRCHHEGDSGEVIPKFLLRSLAGEPMYIFGDGSQTRDFTYVSDTAGGIMLAGTSERALGQTINLGQGSEITIKQLSEEITELCGNDNARVEYVEDRPGDVLRLYADSSRAQELLNFFPRVELREGLQNLKAWYAEQPQTPEQLLESESVRNWEVEN